MPQSASLTLQEGWTQRRSHSGHHRRRSGVHALLEGRSLRKEGSRRSPLWRSGLAKPTVQGSTLLFGRDMRQTQKQEHVKKMSTRRRVPPGSVKHFLGINVCTRAEHPSLCTELCCRKPERSRSSTGRQILSSNESWYTKTNVRATGLAFKNQTVTFFWCAWGEKWAHQKVLSVFSKTPLKPLFMQ